MYVMYVCTQRTVWNAGHSDTVHLGQLFYLKLIPSTSRRIDDELA